MKRLLQQLSFLSPVVAPLIICSVCWVLLEWQLHEAGYPSRLFATKPTSLAGFYKHHPSNSIRRALEAAKKNSVASSATATNDVATPTAHLPVRESSDKQALDKPSSADAPIRLRDLLPPKQAGQDESTVSGAVDAANAGADKKKPSSRLLIQILVEGEGMPPVDLNGGDVKELLTLPAVDASQAQTILAYRKQHAETSALPPFGEATELAHVGGFSPELVEMLRPFIGVDSEEAASVVRMRPLSLVADSNTKQQRWALRFPGAESVAIEFGEFNIDSNYPLQLSDGSGRVVAIYGGPLGAFVTRPIPGDTVKIYWPRAEGKSTKKSLDRFRASRLIFLGEND